MGENIRPFISKFLRSFYRDFNAAIADFHDGDAARGQIGIDYGLTATTDDYFFLPNLGYYHLGRLYGVGFYAYYWTYSPYSGGTSWGGGEVWTFGFSEYENAVYVTEQDNNLHCYREYGFVAGQRPDGTPWFK